MKTASLNDAAVAFDRISTDIAQQLLQARLEIQYGLALASGRRLAKAQSVEARVAAKDDLLLLLNASDLVSNAYVGYPNGDYVRYGRVLPINHPPASLHGAAAWALHILENRDGRKFGWYWFYDKNYKLLAKVNETNNDYDPRTRPWFKAGINEAAVTPPYIFASNHHLGYTVSEKSPAGSVFAADVDLGSTPEVLTRLLPSPSAVAAGVRGDSGVVFAFSNGRAIEQINEHRTTPATIDDIGSPPLAAAFRAAETLPFMAAHGTYTDSHHKVWLYTVTPGRRANGSVVLFPVVRNHKTVYLPRAVLVLAAPEEEIIANATHVRNDALLVCGGLLLAMIPVAYWFSQLVSRPLVRLRGDALALRSLDFTERPSPSSIITEVDEFAQTFGAMRSHIREYNDAVANFIPRQFLELLGQRELKNLKLGDHTERVMSMLFSDIRSFTTLSGRLTPDETFRFVNSYLTQIGPIIREQHGFIDKYIGDAIFALFPDNASDALNAAVEMQRRVVSYNEGRARAGYMPIAIGVGVHRGNLMLGTIGESRRYETTVISDAVNLASRMESLTKAFGALILATREIMQDVNESDYCARRLGEVLVKGATHPVTVYEICDADPAALLAHKMQTKDEFELGRLAYAHGDFKEAAKLFGEIAAADAADHAAAYYRDRAATLGAELKTSTWDGVEHMESK